MQPKRILNKVINQMLSAQFIQPSGSPATEVMNFSLPQHCLPWLPAVAHYLRQNLLIFLHVPKYTDSNTAHHFKVPIYQTVCISQWPLNFSLVSCLQGLLMGLTFQFHVPKDGYSGLWLNLSLGCLSSIGRIDEDHALLSVLWHTIRF